MNAILIFKMEFYKFLNDKKYLIIAGVLALLNILLTLKFLSDMEQSYYGYYNSGYGNNLTSLLVMSFSISAIFLFIYPFHALAMDYKNNVMALMMASGVNRTKLYFAKIGATVVTSFLLMLIVIIIPVVLVSLKYGSIDQIMGAFFDGILNTAQYMDVSIGLYLFSMILAYTAVIVMINFAVIFMKGSSKTILTFLGLMIALGIFETMFIKPMVNIYEMSGNGLIAYQMIVDVLKIAVFGILSLRQMNKQNL